MTCYIQSTQHSSKHKAKCSRSSAVVVVIYNYGGQKRNCGWGGFSGDPGQQQGMKWRQWRYSIADSPVEAPRGHVSLPLALRRVTHRHSTCCPESMAQVAYAHACIWIEIVLRDVPKWFSLSRGIMGDVYFLLFVYLYFLIIKQLIHIVITEINENMFLKAIIH